MAFTAPLGADYFTVNKGATGKIMYQRGPDEGYRVSDWYATEKVFEPEDELPPDSDKRFVLRDGKEISVKEAAAFFENYLNSVKTATAPMFKNKVVSVTPYRFLMITLIFCILGIQKSTTKFPLTAHKAVQPTWEERQNTECA